MAEIMKENGRTITWMDMEFTFGKMEENIKGSMQVIRSTGMESINGLMAGFIRDIGIEESNMDSAFIKQRMKKTMMKPSMDSGKKERELSGLINRKSSQSTQRS